MRHRHSLNCTPAWPPEARLQHPTTHAARCLGRSQPVAVGWRLGRARAPRVLGVARCRSVGRGVAGFIRCRVSPGWGAGGDRGKAGWSCRSTQHDVQTCSWRRGRGQQRPSGSTPAPTPAVSWLDTALATSRPAAGAWKGAGSRASHRIAIGHSLLRARCCAQRLARVPAVIGLASKVSLCFICRSRRARAVAGVVSLRCAFPAPAQATKCSARKTSSSSCQTVSAAVAGANKPSAMPARLVRSSGAALDRWTRSDTTAIGI